MPNGENAVKWGKKLPPPLLQKKNYYISSLQDEMFGLRWPQSKAKHLFLLLISFDCSAAVLPSGKVTKQVDIKCETSTSHPHALCLLNIEGGEGIQAA